MSARHARTYLEREISQHRALEGKLMDYAVWGRLPRPRLHQDPGPAERAHAATKAGDVARERMLLEQALVELGR